MDLKGEGREGGTKGEKEPTPPLCTIPLPPAQGPLNSIICAVARGGSSRAPSPFNYCENTRSGPGHDFDLAQYYAGELLNDDCRKLNRATGSFRDWGWVCL